MEHDKHRGEVPKEHDQHGEQVIDVELHGEQDVELHGEQVVDVELHGEQEVKLLDEHEKGEKGENDPGMHAKTMGKKKCAMQASGRTQTAWMKNDFGNQ